MRAGEVLRSLGWESSRRTVAGKRRRVWVEPEEDVPPISEVDQGLESSVSDKIQPSISPGQSDQPNQLSIQRLSIPKKPASIRVQEPDPTWTTSKPQKEKVPGNDHDPTPNIQPLSDRELATLMATGGEGHV